MKSKKNDWRRAQKALLTSLVSMLTTACVTTDIDPTTKEEALRPLVCANEIECTLYWQRAQFWVSSSSVWKLQIITDTVLETYTPQNADIRLGFKVLRERNSDGSSRIRIGAYCGNTIGCKEHPLSAIRRFKLYVSTGKFEEAAKTE